MIAGDTTFHPRFSNISARVAAGALLNMTDAIIQGRVRNGFAVIRPPGMCTKKEKNMTWMLMMMTFRSSCTR